MRIVWSREALEDLDAIFDHIVNENPAAAVRALERIEERVAALRTFSALGRPGRVHGTRELVVGDYPYVIPYRVKSGSVQILRVFHAARTWPDHFDD